MKVEIKEFSVTYQDHDHALMALDRVELTIAPGRVTALVGESGSGKTTLAKAVMGLLPENAASRGSIRLEGRELIGLDEAEMNRLRGEEAAMVFQGGAANLNPVARVLDQVAEPLVQRRGVRRASARVQALEELARMGLDERQATRYPHQLSGGQAQRALLAMALILDPGVLILDEPTSALDAMTKMFVSGVIQGLKNQGKAILLITHDLDLAVNLGDEAAVLYLGQVMERVRAGDLLVNPRHPYTLALGRSYPGMDAARDLGGIRGDAFFRLVHAHASRDGASHTHAHVDAPGAAHETGHAPPTGCLFEPRCTQGLPECRAGRVKFTRAAHGGVRCLRGGIVEILSLKGVSKAHGQVRALWPTDLSLKAGEVFCLVGATGSGKTTLALSAGGAITPDQGARAFQGRDMDEWIKRDYRSLAPQIGIIGQHPVETVSHRFTVFEIVAEPLLIQNRRLPKDEVARRVLAALGDVRLSTRQEFLRRYPHELNMGALQRVCLARALVHEPTLLIADEPTSALDPSAQAKVLKMLLNLQIEKGLTMLFVTHDLGLARKIGDRLGVMLAGRVVEQGPAPLLMGRPAHPYTRMLMDSALGRGRAVDQGIASASETGCAFFHLCPRRLDVCRLDQPPLAELEDGRRQVWCFRPLGGAEA